MKMWRLFARAVYRTNRATRTASAWSGVAKGRRGSGRRVAKLYTRRLAYKGFAHFMNWILR